MNPYRLDDLPYELALLIRVHPVSGCWVWIGKCNAQHYGRWRSESVHRLVYELLIGRISPGLTIDHVEDRGCITKACCWPVHLEPVTMAENLRRMTRRPQAGEAWTSATPLQASKFRQHLTSYLDSAEKDGMHFEIQRFTDPSGVLVPPDWYEEAKALMDARKGEK